MKAILYILTLGAILFPTRGIAESQASENALHFAAHFGMGYAIDNVLWGFNQKAFHMEEDGTRGAIVSEVFAGLGTEFANIIYEAQENASTQQALRSVGYTTLGIGASILTRCMFHYKW